MFSKRNLVWVFGAVVLLIGCQKLVGEKAANIPAPKNKIGTEARCISNAAPVIKDYFRGATTAEDLADAALCFESALDLFGKKVRGASPNYYHAGEISDFIEGYFVDEGTKIGTGFMTEVLRVKQLLVGGKDDRLTRDELLALHGMIRTGGKLMIETLPYMKIYSEHWQVSGDRVTSRAEFAAAEKGFSEKLAQYWPSLKGTYDLKNLQSLADAIVRSFPDSKGFQVFQQGLKKYLPAMIAAKSIILNDQTTVISRGDWSELLEHVPAIYSRYLYVQYFLKDAWFWGPSLDDLEIFADKSVQTFRAILVSRGDGISTGVTLNELNRLAEGVGAAGFLGHRFSAETLKNLVPVVVNRILTPSEQRLAGKLEETLNEVSVGVFQAEFQNFMTVQRKLDLLWSGRSVIAHTELQAAFAGASGAFAEFAKVIESPLSMAFDRQDRLYLDPNKEINYTTDAALKLNIARTIARLGIRSYGSSASQISDLTHLTKAEVTVQLFNEFRPVLVGAELIEADNDTFAKNRFIEANLFTPLANGDENLDFAEGSAMALMIWSGINVNSEIPTDPSCLAGTTKNIVTAGCAMEQMRKDVPAISTSMPHMGVALTSMSQADGHKMLMDLLVASGWEPNAELAATLSDIGLVPHVLQYIESVFRRWDLNKDGLIDKTETLAAEPIFRPLLSTVSGQSDPALLRAAFAWIVTYQTNPASDPWGFFEFMGDESKWVINVDRAGVGRILGFIAEEIRKKNSPAPVRTAEKKKKRRFIW